MSVYVGPSSQSNTKPYSQTYGSPPFIKGCEFDKTKPRLTFEIFPDKVGAGGTIKLKVS